MALGLNFVFVLVLCASLFRSSSAGSSDCEEYTDSYGNLQRSKYCYSGTFCCGTCSSRYCCSQRSHQLTEDAQDNCQSFNFHSASSVPMIVGIVGSIVTFLVFICCCVCPCCCLYKMCRKPQPVLTTTTTTVVTTNPIPQQYPQQPVAMPGHPQSYQGASYAPYQPIPVQPGYGAQPMPPSAYPGQQFKAGPPPTYQEATGPAYPPQPVPYSHAAFTPGQPAYPLQPPVIPQHSTAPPSQMDYLSQPAYNPDYVAPPTKG